MDTNLEITGASNDSLDCTDVSFARWFGRTLLAAGLVSSVMFTYSRADVVTDWNEITQDFVGTFPDPALGGRTAAITQIAVFDAVNSIMGDYEPYLEKIDAPAGASPEAAAIAAAHRALVVLHPENATAFDAARAESLAAISDGKQKNDGIAVGIAAADAILELRAGDGFDVEVPYQPGAGPGEWRPTPPELIPAFRPGLGDVATFGIASGRHFRVRPPPNLRSRVYARHYAEVKRVGVVDSPGRTQYRTDSARFYAASESDSIYHPAARQVSAAQGKTLSENARIFALLTIAIWDGAVACFDSKYHYNFWRPVTAIHTTDNDHNSRTDPDPDWQPLVFTPPFPSYPSGHASFGGAARAVLEHVFGDKGHSITLTNPRVPGVVLRYTTFKQITDDIDEARIDGGVHFRFDQEEGARQGRRVGEYLIRHELRPLRGGDCEKRGGVRACPANLRHTRD